MAITAISVTQIQPMVRCGSVPLRAANWTSPSTNAAIAAKAWSWMTGEAFRRGASVIVPLPESLLAEKRPDLVGRLVDRNDAEQMPVRPGQRGGFNRHAIRGDLLGGLLDIGAVENQVGRRVDQQRGQLDLARIGREELVCFREIEQVVRIRDRGARRRSRLERRLDLALVAERLGRVLAFLGGWKGQGL